MKTLSSRRGHILLWSVFLAAGLVTFALTAVSYPLALDLVELIRSGFYELVSVASDPYNFV